MPKRLSIVVPVFNEKSTIVKVIKSLLEVALPPGWSKEIVVVDDGSTDGTRQVLKNFDKAVKTIFRNRNGGKGAALKDGFTVATGDYVIIQDADCEYDPADFISLLQPIITGQTEVVFGSRVLNKNAVPFSRIYFYGGLAITKIFNLFFGSRITDVATCYKIFPRKYVEELIKLPSNDFVFDVVELSHFLVRDAKIIEIPIRYISRKKKDGKKMSSAQGWLCFQRILSIFIVEKIGKIANGIRNFRDRYKKIIGYKSYIQLLLVFTLFFCVFFTVYFSVGIVSSADDHYFHFRFAQEMLGNGFPEAFQDFKSIYYSKMADGNQYFVYYNFLFYLFIIPFTFLTPLYLGIKLYAVVAATVAFTLFYWCLKQLEIRNPLIWTILIIAITNVTSIWRFFLSRPYALAPSLLLLLLVCLYRRKYQYAFLISFIYMYWHSATFFLPICVAIGYFIIERFYRTKGDYLNLISVASGTGLAILATFLVSSGFGSYMKDIIFGTYWDTILGKKVAIAEGAELYPVDFFTFIQGNALIFASFVTSICVDIYSYIGYKFRESSSDVYFADLPTGRRHLQTCVLVLSALFFLGTVSVSGRFGDYFTLFAGLYIALSFDYARRLIQVSGPTLIRNSIATGLTIVLGYLFLSNMLFLQQRIARGSPPNEFYQIGRWLDRNTKPGEVVFLANWSWFPQLYYYSPKNFYSSGLEPRFMYDYNPRLYWLSVHMANDGYVCDQDKCPELDEEKRLAFNKPENLDRFAIREGNKMADVLRKDFKLSYIVTSKEYRFFDYILDTNNNFEKKIYNNEFGYFVYMLK